MTPRQQKLLRAIIDEFIETAEAVGSVSLANKYNLGVSPATIRNEMADLVDQGFLQKPHSSSGRIPTDMGIKHFISRVMEDLDDHILNNSNNIYENLFQTRFNRTNLIKTALDTLASESGNAALLLLDDNLRFSGLSNLTLQPEFQNMRRFREVLKLIEDYDLLRSVFENFPEERDIMILVGEDSGWTFLSNASLIFSKIKLHGEDKGYLAVLGPNRMDYRKVIPVFEFMSKSINKVVSGW